MNPALLVAGFLVFSRLGGLLMTLPGISSKAVPPWARMALALPLSVVLLPTVPLKALPVTLPGLVAAGISEAIVGVAMGTCTSVAFGGFAAAVDLVGTKMGMNLAMMLDPLSHVQEGAIASLGGWLATGAFLVTDTHLRCIEVLGASLRVLPPGATTSPGAFGPVLAELVGVVLATSVQLAGPVVAFVFLVNLAILVLGRMAPNLQLFYAVGTSFTLVAGMLILTAALPSMLGTFVNMLGSLPDWLARVVMAVSGG